MFGSPMFFGGVQALARPAQTSQEVQDELKQVTRVQATKAAFAALLQDGSAAGLRIDCIILCCVVLYYTISYYAILYFSILYGIML